jgi:hypothetical protein
VEDAVLPVLVFVLLELLRVLALLLHAAEKTTAKARMRCMISGATLFVNCFKALIWSYAEADSRMMRVKRESDLFTDVSF